MELNTNIEQNIANGKLQEAKTANLMKLAGEGEFIGKKNLSKLDKARIAKASRGFEAIFVNMMLKQMKAGIPKNESDNMMTFGAETLEGYNDMMFADEIANKGKGIGIAEMVYYQLSGGDKLHYKSQENSSTISDLLSKASINNGYQDSFISKLKSRISKYDDIISLASDSYGVDKELIQSVISAESAGKENAVSKAGAKGLMQIMDSTAEDLGIENVFNPIENINGGTKYLKNMIDKFEDKDLALAAYNAGPSNILKYGDIPPFPETKSYVNRVNKYLEIFKEK